MKSKTFVTDIKTKEFFVRMLKMGMGTESWAFFFIIIIFKSRKATYVNLPLKFFFFDKFL